ncbi:Sensor protein FixL [Bremerella volcania]|uniref:Sensor protein FixL n=1 Tax=Bremerella volcania TaxID=2527984 RepID=A0A518C5X2_9BACT|nr:PAS domain S-box protein [Bremerella volcania]QDU74623.1 Sensor protein FixL [Bremerella volcania]
MATDSETRLKSIVQTAVDGIITIDERGSIDTFNAAAERLFGYRANEVIGKNVSMLMPSPYRDQDDEFLAQYLATGDKKIIGIGREAVGRRKDGSTFPMHLSVGEMRLGDKRFFTGILHNISDRKQAEERALQEERLAAIGQMIGVVTQESRNVLQRMVANLEMAAMEIEDRPEALEYISRTQAAQDDLHHLYEELRSYAARITLERELCRVDHLVGQVLNDISASHKSRQIRLRPNNNGCDTRCEVDPFRMNQVFRNMVENSLAACADPLSIELLLSDTEFKGRAAVDLCYRDNGTGLNEEQRRRMFEPFFTTKTKGTGLGMAISKRIVEAHGGQMAVGGKVTPGGAEFLITLPRQSA